MGIVNFGYLQTDSDVENVCMKTFGVNYESSDIVGLELNLYAITESMSAKKMINERKFRQLQIALIYYVYFKRHASSIKGFFARKKFLRMSRLTKMIVIEAVKQAENANAFSLMGSSNPTHR